MATGPASRGTRLELLQGTLDLMVLQTRDTMGPQHGYGMGRRIEQMSDAILRLNKGPSTPRSCGCSTGDGPPRARGISEANRNAKFYAITVAGKRQLAPEVEAWYQVAGLVARLRGTEQG
jgi:DNA-binding PadR family transcriptional regulator